LLEAGKTLGINSLGKKVLGGKRLIPRGQGARTLSITNPNGSEEITAAAPRATASKRP
jgi:hypothetical protein